MICETGQMERPSSFIPYNSAGNQEPVQQHGKGKEKKLSSQAEKGG